ncbi:MAG TPA: YbaY family lipoprotein [Rhodanobacteraceae bacterium]
MRTMVLSLAVLAALGLAGCSGSGSGTPQGQAATQGTTAASAPSQLASSVSGTIGLSNPQAHKLSDKAVLTIKLQDVSLQGAAPLASKTISPIASLPVSFNFKLTPHEIHASDLYVVQAEIVDGVRHYTMPLQAPVLTRGATNHADIRLVAQLTPAEEMMGAFKKLKGDAGAMKMTKGTALSSKVSRGWQVFHDPTTGKVRYVVELANYVKGGFTHTQFAYQDGKPWVVIQVTKPNQHALPSQIDRAGWDADGKLVLMDKVEGNSTTTLDAATAAKLHADAVAMLSRAQKTR